MSAKRITGSFVAIITPFNKDGSVDFEAFRSLLKFHQDNGTAAILIMGSTGETSMLSPEEKKKIIVETAKMKTAAMPIFYGCTGNNTDSTIANVKFAKDNGADGAILAAPAYICAPEDDIERFFLDIADATDLYEVARWGNGYFSVVRSPALPYDGRIAPSRAPAATTAASSRGVPVWRRISVPSAVMHAKCPPAEPPATTIVHTTSPVGSSYRWCATAARVVP